MEPGSGDKTNHELLASSWEPWFRGPQLRKHCWTAKQLYYLSPKDVHLESRRVHIGEFPEDFVEKNFNEYISNIDSQLELLRKYDEGDLGGKEGVSLRARAIRAQQISELKETTENPQEKLEKKRERLFKQQQRRRQLFKRDLGKLRTPMEYVLHPNTQWKSHPAQLNGSETAQEDQSHHPSVEVSEASPQKAKDPSSSTPKIPGHRNSFLARFSSSNPHAHSGTSLGVPGKNRQSNSFSTNSSRPSLTKERTNDRVNGKVNRRINKHTDEKASFLSLVPEPEHDSDDAYSYAPSVSPSIAPSSVAPEFFAPDSLAPESIAPGSIAPTSPATDSVAPGSISPQIPPLPSLPPPSSSTMPPSSISASGVTTVPPDSTFQAPTVQSSNVFGSRKVRWQERVLPGHHNKKHQDKNHEHHHHHHHHHHHNGKKQEKVYQGRFLVQERKTKARHPKVNEQLAPLETQLCTRWKECAVLSRQTGDPLRPLVLYFYECIDKHKLIRKSQRSWNRSLRYKVVITHEFQMSVFSPLDFTLALWKPKRFTGKMRARQQRHQRRERRRNLRRYSKYLNGPSAKSRKNKRQKVMATLAPKWARNQVEDRWESAHLPSTHRTSGERSDSGTNEDDSSKFTHILLVHSIRLPVIMDLAYLLVSAIGQSNQLTGPTNLTVEVPSLDATTQVRVLGNHDEQAFLASLAAPLKASETPTVLTASVTVPYRELLSPAVSTSPDLQSLMRSVNEIAYLAGKKLMAASDPVEGKTSVQKKVALAWVSTNANSSGAMSKSCPLWLPLFASHMFPMTRLGWLLKYSAKVVMVNPVPRCYEGTSEEPVPCEGYAEEVYLSSDKWRFIKDPRQFLFLEDHYLLHLPAHDAEPSMLASGQDGMVKDILPYPIARIPERQAIPKQPYPTSISSMSREATPTPTSTPTPTPPPPEINVVPTHESSSGPAPARSPLSNKSDSTLANAQAPTAGDTDTLNSFYSTQSTFSPQQQEPRPNQAVSGNSDSSGTAFSSKAVDLFDVTQEEELPVELKDSQAPQESQVPQESPQTQVQEEQTKQSTPESALTSQPLSVKTYPKPKPRHGIDPNHPNKPSTPIDTITWISRSTCLREIDYHDRIARTEFERRCHQVENAHGMLDLLHVDSITQVGTNISISHAGNTETIQVRFSSPHIARAWKVHIDNTMAFWKARHLSSLMLAATNIQEDWSITPILQNRAIVLSDQLFMKHHLYTSFKACFLVLTPCRLLIFRSKQYHGRAGDLGGRTSAAALHQKKYKEIDLSDAYIYTGQTARPNIVDNDAFTDPANPGVRALPRAYEDGSISTETELDRCFVVQTPKRTWSFLTRSRLLRDKWTSAIRYAASHSEKEDPLEKADFDSGWQTGEREPACDCSK